MKLKIRYENTFQEIEVELREMEGWLDISVESDEPIDDREKCVQETVDILLNRPDYNDWHKMDRHRGIPPKPYRKDDQDADNTDGMEYIEDVGYARRIEEKEEYEAVCSEINFALIKKPAWAAAVIAVYINEEPIRKYAARIGANENSITQMLKRAKKRLKEYFRNRKIL
ncbi:hypothetical protein [Acidaminococcus fermentans]|uniref:hypothetical protein n=1 Tax=Acidaminococcus fermentans TaxID=905 RepID=UPI0020606093|nr:hypothetical protein [Acidaminococcus fermentans]DAL38895.1 MAG TPA_asm: ECF sigma factor [Caudoviricetes sp.]